MGATTAVILDAWQVTSLLELGGLGAPVDGSPLGLLRRHERPLAPGDPGWDDLVARGLLRPDGDGFRVNLALRTVLAACAAPDEVIDIGVSDRSIPGYTVVRRGGLSVECTVTPAGWTKLAFPLSRSAVITTLVAALSSDRPEPPPTGWHLQGSPIEAFVLGSVLRAWREDPVPQPLATLTAAVRRDLGVPVLAAPFAISGGPAALAALSDDDAAIGAVIRGLVAGGHLVASDDGIGPSATVATVFDADPSAVLGVGRTEIRHGRAHRTSMTATRVGDRTLVFRIASPAGAPVRFEWAEVDRRMLRWLVFGMLLSSEELAAALDLAGDGTDTAGDGAGAPAPPPLTFAPDHEVVGDGADAYARPDPDAPVVATLDPGLELELVEQRSGWARVRASNGWSGWVSAATIGPR